MLVRNVLAEHGHEALEGDGNQDGSAPYGPIAAALRQLHRRRPIRIEAGLGSQLAALLPELGPESPTSDRATLFEAIRAVLVRAASERNVTLFLDDLQGADHATLDLLPPLARSLEHAPVAIVGAYRSDDIPRNHPLRGMRAELRRAGRLREVAVEPFDRAVAAELLSAILGTAASPALSTAVFDRTDGLPFFVEELGSALVAGGRLTEGAHGLELAEGHDLPIPDSVRDAVLLR